MEFLCSVAGVFTQDVAPGLPELGPDIGALIITYIILFFFFGGGGGLGFRVLGGSLS